MAPVSLSLDPPLNPLVRLGIPPSTQLSLLKEPRPGQKWRSGSDPHTGWWKQDRLVSIKSWRNDWFELIWNRHRENHASCWKCANVIPQARDRVRETERADWCVWFTIRKPECLAWLAWSDIINLDFSFKNLPMLVRRCTVNLRCGLEEAC